MIELLVVIVIISLLAALSFPLVSSSLESARRAASLNNLRSIGLAILTKQADTGITFPQMRNYAWQGPQEPGMEFPWMQDFLADSLGEPGPNGELPDVYRNPLVLSHGRPAWMLDAIHTHYRYNGISAPGRVPKKNSRAVLMFEAVWPDWPAGDFPYKPGTTKAAIQVFYADGHIESLMIERYQEMNPTAGESIDDPFYADGWLQ